MSLQLDVLSAHTPCAGHSSCRSIVTQAWPAACPAISSMAVCLPGTCSLLDMCCHVASQDTASGLGEPVACSAHRCCTLGMPGSLHSVPVPCLSV